MNRNAKFVFWNVKQRQPYKEFCVDIYLQDGKLKIGEISDKLYKTQYNSSQPQPFPSSTNPSITDSNPKPNPTLFKVKD